MSGVAKRANIRENSPVEFDLDGRMVTCTVVRLEHSGNVVVQYGSGNIVIIW